MTTILRINKIKIGKDSSNFYSWIDNFTLNYKPINIRVGIPIPYGAMTHQKILSPNIDGTIHCRDFNKMLTAVYNTAIDEDNNTALKNINVNYTIPYTVGYLQCEMVGADNTIKTATFTDFIIGTLYPNSIEFNGDTRWVIEFESDTVIYG